MIILLEGADCSGKTTLAEKLLEALREKAVYVHHTEKNNTIADFSRTLNEAADRRAQGQWTIIDRLWISEMIYGPLMRDANRDPEGIVARLCHMHGVVTVMCIRYELAKHLNHFRETQKTRHEYASEQIINVIQAYHDLWYGTLNGQNDLPFNRASLYYHFSRFSPLKLLRSYYQYDMDKFTSAQFTNWLLRLGEDKA